MATKKAARKSKGLKKATKLQGTKTLKPGKGIAKFAALRYQGPTFD